MVQSEMLKIAVEVISKDCGDERERVTKIEGDGFIVRDGVWIEIAEVVDDWVKLARVD